MNYGSKENEQAMQELATLIDKAVAGWAVAHPTGAVEVKMSVALLVAGRPGVADVSTFFGGWDGTSKEGEGWARGLAARKAELYPAPGPNRAQRRAGRGN